MREDGSRVNRDGSPAPFGVRLLVVIAAAAFLAVLAPPANWHRWHWFAYLPMFWALDPRTPRANRWLSWVYGAVGLAVIFRWITATITTFAPVVPWPAAATITGLFGIVYGLPHVLIWTAVHPLRRRLGSAWVLAWPAWFVLIEWVAMWLTLFPFNHGVSQYRAVYTWQLASITGIWGLTFLVAFVNAVLAEAMYRVQEGQRLPFGWFAAAGGTLAAVVTFGAWRYGQVEAMLREAPTLRYGQIQTAKGMEWRLTHPANEAFDDWLRLTQSIPEGTDLTVWPEGACPFSLAPQNGRVPARTRLLSKVAQDQNLELVVGAGTYVRQEGEDGGRETINFNSVYHFERDGSLGERYDKMVPLPFGEYWPFGSFLKELSYQLGIGNFRPGDTPVVFQGDRAKMASPICYEAILPHVCRRFDEAEMFVTVTNDAWFLDTSAPHLHAMLAAVRSTELGIPMIRSAYTGVSFVVEPHGAILHETVPFTDVARVVEVRLGQSETIYRRFGDWLVVVCALGLATGWGLAPTLRDR
ncbi:MAG: apolipoprotein N-acyltransferase [Myxococcota bacterium]